MSLHFDQNIAIPSGRVEIALSQIGAYIPNDPSQDFLASSFSDSLGKTEMVGLVYDKALEAIRLEYDYNLRDNFIAFDGVRYSEPAISYYSNPEKEIKRRMWEIKRSIYQLFMPLDNEFEYPTFNKPYKTDYTGSRFSSSSYYSPARRNKTNIEKVLYSANGSTSSSGNTSEENNEEENVITAKGKEVFWITQESTNSEPWRMKQVEPNFKNQAFHFSVKKTAVSTNLEPTPNNNCAFPAHGAYIAIMIGGGLESIIYGDPEERENGPNGDSNGEENENEEELDSPNLGMTKEDYNRLTIVFPIGEAPYILWSDAWVYNISSDTMKMDEVPEGTPDILDNFKLEVNEDLNWILYDEIDEFNLDIFSFNGKIYIKSNFCEEPWIFPREPQIIFKNLIKIKTGKDVSPQISVSSFEATILKKELEVQGRGFKCSLNMTPIEFHPSATYLNSRSSNGQTYEGVDEYPHLKFPFLTYSKGLGRSGQVIDTWGGGLTSPQSFQLPGNYVEGSPLPKYGYDYNPNTGKTTHGLLPDCLELKVIDDFSASEIPKNLFGSPGFEIATKDTSKLSQYTNFIRFALVYKYDPLQPVDDEDIGSQIYCTPFFTRIKFKGRVIKSAPSADEWIDITNQVQGISYSSKVEECCIRKNINIDLLLPKQADSNRSDYPVPDRLFWASLQRKHFLVRVFLGFDDQSSNAPDLLKVDHEIPYFTGVAWGGNINYTSSRDSFNISATDLTETLNDIPTFNSPWYDGMDLSFAVATALERAGFSALSSLETGDVTDDSVLEFSISQRALPLTEGWVLPDSLNYANPTLRFSPGTKTLDIIKGFVNRFWLLFKTTRQGGFQIDCWPGSDITNTYGNAGEEQYNNIRYVPTNALIPGQGNEFNADPSYYMYQSIPTELEEGNRLYFLLKDTKIIRMKPSKWNNMFGIATINRVTGMREIVTDGDPESIANPSSPNFIGFMKAGFVMQAGYGGLDAARNSLRLITQVLFKPIMIVNATIWGNRLLEPLDVIRVDGNNYRIIDISADITTEGFPAFTMNITGENVNDSTPTGQWNIAEPLNIIG